ncbi:MAG: lytic transglycosylase domain-containing protein [Bdellovibrionales bacterium]|nr:lytic transglycosylase domain-containing protein [Bdellovibrionales bacterium]
MSKKNPFKSFLVVTVLLVSYVGVTCVFYDLDSQRKDRVQLRQLDTGAYDVSSLSSSNRKAFKVISNKLSHTKIARPDLLAAIITFESEARGVDPLFVTAIIFRESTFNHKAVSKVGARGLMQLLPTTARYIAQKEGLEWKGADALFQPAYNIRLGIAYLQYLQNGFNNKPRLALMAYNWGPGNLKGALAKNISPYTSVKNYAEKVMVTYESLKGFVLERA